MIEEHYLKDKNILLVDDNVQNMYALSNYLETKGMNIYTVENGLDAIKFLQNQETQIDIVLMDIMMPDMDGFETIQKIKAEPGIRDVTIIAVTAKAMKGDKEKCLEAGAEDYVSKPIDLMELQHKMVAHIKNK